MPPSRKPSRGGLLGGALAGSEHVLSQELADLIAAKLRDLRLLLHGDPIPTRDGRLVGEPTGSLAELQVRVRSRRVRVSDFAPEMLRYLTRCGIELADELTVLQPEAFGGSLLVQVVDREHSIGPDLAAALRVQVPV